ncbi:DNA repair helicase XPB [Paenibacillus physcomitrellae]|uniref:DNA 3'-5' helicase n=1 Tax=Paenibacillus physcomitrellae TaxID=1619311 RepID=A0ABQ1FM40_9BACL|nr:DNA repair helicase XPB [Paenibacillus physcomitrellae]GGA21705.1 DEAD/DEAH box helicase [Paenibacillus physcomitrellae]
MKGQGACIVQNDHTILLETAHAEYEAGRQTLGQIAELLKTPALFHTYRLTPLSLWHAAALGETEASVLEKLRFLSRWPVPAKVEENVKVWMDRYGQLELKSSGPEQTILVLEARQGAEEMLGRLLQSPSLQGLGLSPADQGKVYVPAASRGLLKQELTRMGYPVLDKVGYRKGTSLPLELKPVLPDGSPFQLRDYQRACIEAFAGSSKTSSELAGSGVLVLPCGAGKTVIGIGAMQRLQCETLILTSNITSVRQWIQELQNKTTLVPELIGEYSGERKEVRPVTVSTYQILTHRTRKEEGFRHLPLLSGRNWGLIIYDEVHLLPAPVFRATADIQATRRLGLTATLVREDGCEQDVFSLIGPKQKEVAWKELEGQGWIAEVDCQEIRIPLPREVRNLYERMGRKEQYRTAAENPDKTAAVRQLMNRHEGRQILIIGQYVDQLEQLALELKIPLITGASTQQQRSALYTGFRAGDIRVLAVSKVANFAVDLPDASVAIQISGSYGSRQEEAQRLGRILRPKRGDNRAFFYSLVSAQTREEEFARRRQLFLVEQGYEYTVVNMEEQELQGERQQTQREA